jgi:hypothetical protein
MSPTTATPRERHRRALSITEEVTQRASALREVEHFLRRLPEPGNLLVLQHEPQEPMRPRKRERRHLEQTKQMAGRRRVHDDARIAALGEELA